MLLYSDYTEKKRAVELEALNRQYMAEQKQKEEERLQLIEQSSFYQKLKYGFDVNILVVGDSIGAGSGASSTETRWASLLQQYIRSEYMIESENHGKVSLTNVSMGGNVSYAGYVRTLLESEEYDFVILCYGQNDQIDGFEVQYEVLIRAAKRKNPDASIIAILESSQREITEKMMIIQKLCSYYNIPVVDTIKAFNESGNDYLELATDGIHPNDQGYKIYFEAIKGVIEENIVAETGKLSELPPINSECLKYENFIWYGIEGEKSFTRIDDLTYQMDVQAQGIMGIDYTFKSKNDQTQIYVDGQIIEAPTSFYDYDLSQRKILIASNECNVNEEIKIVFDTKERADEFKGIGFSWK